MGREGPAAAPASSPSTRASAASPSTPARRASTSCAGTWGSWAPRRAATLGSAAPARARGRPPGTPVPYPRRTVDGPVTTTKGLAGEVGALRTMREAFLAHDAHRCGFRMPGQIMGAVAIVAEGRAGSKVEVRQAMSGNLCRGSACANVLCAAPAGRDAMEPPSWGRSPSRGRAIQRTRRGGSPRPKRARHRPAPQAWRRHHAGGPNRLDVLQLDLLIDLGPLRGHLGAIGLDDSLRIGGPRHHDGRRRFVGCDRLGPATGIAGARSRLGRAHERHPGRSTSRIAPGTNALGRLVNRCSGASWST